MNLRMLPSNLHNVRGGNKFLHCSPGALCGIYRGSLVFQQTETSMPPFHIRPKVCGSVVRISNSRDNFDCLIKTEFSYQISVCGSHNLSFQVSELELSCTNYGRSQ